MKKRIYLLIALILLVSVFAACGAQPDAESDGRFSVITTTTMLADMARVIGGESVQVEGLMGPGIDPHLYKASAGDVSKMQNADMVVFNGLHLEGKMGEIFESLEGGGQVVVEIAKGINEDDLILIEDASYLHDPHIWFDVLLWKDAAQVLLDGFIQLDPENEEAYNANYESYILELEDLNNYVLERTNELEASKRVLITAHDAFTYFGQAYGFEVMGLQGISTASEAGTGDVRDLATYIAENKIKAIFVESSVPRKNIEALQEAVAAQGFNVEIGGELFSDSLGSPGTSAETYIGTVKSNVDTIVDALK